jgi:hypothetical protein
MSCVFNKHRIKVPLRNLRLNLFLTACARAGACLSAFLELAILGAKDVTQGAMILWVLQCKA